MIESVDDDEDDPRRLKTAHILREVGIAHLTFRVGKVFSNWKRDVRNDFGEVHERQLYRTINWLVEHGLARRSETKVEYDDRETGTVQTGYLYFRTTELVPEVPVFDFVTKCSLCGAVGMTSRSHREDGTHPTPEEQALLREQRWRKQAEERREAAARLRDAVALWRAQAAQAIETRPHRVRRSSRPARHRRRAA